jgi:hypothetical protein
LTRFVYGFPNLYCFQCSATTIRGLSDRGARGNATLLLRTNVSTVLDGSRSSLLSRRGSPCPACETVPPSSRAPYPGSRASVVYTVGTTRTAALLIFYAPRRSASRRAARLIRLIQCATLPASDLTLIKHRTVSLVASRPILRCKIPPRKIKHQTSAGSN